MPTPEEWAAAQHQMASAEHNRETGQIVEQGRRDFGTQTFDDASQVVAGALGERTPDIMLALRQFDNPAEIVMHLGGNEAQLKAIAKMPTAQQIVELARIEARLSSEHVPSAGALPKWKSEGARTGRVSDTDWGQNFGANLSERAWHKEFDRRQSARNERRR